jgi:hypothetical protein
MKNNCLGILDLFIGFSINTKERAGDDAGIIDVMAKWWLAKGKTGKQGQRHGHPIPGCGA